MAKEIFFGVGGKASSSVFGRYLFGRPGWDQSPTIQAGKPAVLIMSGVDSGGSTGAINDLLELNNFELNKKLHGRKDFPFQSQGDLKQFLVRSLGFASPDVNWGSFLDFRSNAYLEQGQKIQEFGELAKLDKSLIRGFLGYTKTFFEYYEQQQPFLTPRMQKLTCLGNLFLNFCHFKVGDINQLAGFLVEVGLFPSWVDFVFLSTNKTHLAGLDGAGRSVLGEHLFDEWLEPILPESYQIHTQGADDCELNPKLVFCLDGLGLDDLLIIPPGSDSNWLGMINVPEIAGRIKDRKILWLANLFRFASETPLPQTINHLNSLGFYPQIYLPSEDFVDTLLSPNNLESLEGYVLREHKLPHSLYLPKYQARIAKKLKALGTNQVSSTIQAELEKNSAKFELEGSQSDRLHYEVEISQSSTSYVHSQDYVEKWLKMLQAEKIT